MTADEFRSCEKVDLSWPKALQALWWDAHGDWEQAHEAAQSGNDTSSAWVHAYLHRKEGDDGNAGYWYHRAGKPTFTGNSDAEWRQMVDKLLRSTKT
jgi:hypothetical protein